MSKFVRAGLFVCLAVAAVAAPAMAAESPAGIEEGPTEFYTLTDSPFSGPVETIVMTDHATVSRGQLTDVFVAVQNHSNVDTVSINIDLDLRYADGRTVRPFHLGADRVATLGPDEGVGFFIFWQIPPDAPVGEGSLRVDARIGRVTGGDDGHADNPNPMIASDAVTFDVVP